METFLTILARVTVRLMPSVFRHFGFFNIMRWLLVGFTAFLLIPISVANQYYLTGLLTIMAIAILLPLTKRFLAKKAPFLASKLARSLLWLILVFMAVTSYPAPSTEKQSQTKTSPTPTSIQASSSPSPKPESLKTRINEYTTIANLDPSPVGLKPINGKVVVVDKTKNAIATEFSSALPEQIRATNPKEVKFVVWLEYKTDHVLDYQSGAKGFQQSCELTLIDKAAKTVLDKQTFTGSMPPKYKQYRGNATGDKPDQQIRKYLANLIAI